MFRNSDITASKFLQKFTELRSKLKVYDSIHLDFGYYRELKSYIDRLHDEFIVDEIMDDKSFDDKREAEMSNLNRLQKLKNSSSYKKSKHKNHHKDEYLD